MDQDSKLLTEAYLTKVNEYRAPSNRGKGHHGEGLSNREELEIDIQDFDKRANEASENGDDRTADRLDRQADELRARLRKLGPRKVGRMRIESVEQLKNEIEEIENDAEAAYRREDTDIGEELDQKAKKLKAKLQSLQHEDIDDPLMDPTEYDPISGEDPSEDIPDIAPGPVDVEPEFDEKDEARLQYEYHKMLGEAKDKAVNIGKDIERLVSSYELPGFNEEHEGDCAQEIVDYLTTYFKLNTQIKTINH